ncbi:hypothetical protein QBC38DRAFT_422126 [Podospora fimiseda]|uniref:Uncharacterized protein n=1 Tax=Podospora fimiseda TaxID=252190 RepID=A0AAN7GV71_9PEZI|nr:hypothetical protein QBC38DRAFT_422126 [Podospora fimiseda]
MLLTQPTCSFQIPPEAYKSKVPNTCTTTTSSTPPLRPLSQLSDLPSLTFKAQRKNGRLRPQPRVKFRNNLLTAAGCIEIANAGDFAANVFNMRPIPTYARVLMAIGGTVALGMVYFIIEDALLSWENIQGLRAERKFLLLEKQKQEKQKEATVGKALQCLLHVNYRDLGAEVIDRFGMDVLLGLGALMVGAGTYMAIGGEDPVIFEASNLLTGYIGNSPIAFYGLANMGWALYVWSRAKRHGVAVKAALGENLDARVKRRLKKRTRRVQLHGLLNGVTGAIAGAASLVTATHWWAYVILGPCILVSVYCNRLWRHHVGYDRPYFLREIEFTESEIVEALKEVDEILQRVGRQHHRRWFASRDVESGIDAVTVLVADYDGSLGCLLEFITYMNLFEDFCRRLVGEEKLISALYQDNGVVFEAKDLLGDDDHADRLLALARDTVSKDARKYLQYREKWLLEILGCYMALAPVVPRRGRKETDSDNQSIISEIRNEAWNVDKI